MCWWYTEIRLMSGRKELKPLTPLSRVRVDVRLNMNNEGDYVGGGS
jgi:hypothetical protein